MGVVFYVDRGEKRGWYEGAGRMERVLGVGMGGRFSVMAG